MTVSHSNNHLGYGSRGLERDGDRDHDKSYLHLLRYRDR
jgi:hypothetical protein